MGTPTAVKPITHVIAVVDRSGSMSRHADVVRSGINEYMQALRDDKDVRYRVSLWLFSDDADLIVSNSKPKNVPPMDGELYVAHGMTALYYAVGRAIEHFEKDVPIGPEEKVILLVQTDGAENHSHVYEDPNSPANAPRALFDRDRIAAMLKERRGRGWTDVYLGAGQDAWSGGHEFGNRVETHSTVTGYGNTYSGLGKFSSSVSRGMHANTAVAELSKDANKDD